MGIFLKGFEPSFMPWKGIVLTIRRQELDADGILDYQLQRKSATTLTRFELVIPTRQVGVIDHFTIEPNMPCGRESKPKLFDKCPTGLI